MTSLIGAEVFGVDLREPLHADVVAEIRSLLLKWRVIFFRDQHITPEQQISFGAQFGKVTPAHPAREGVAGHPELYALDVQEVKEYLDGSHRLAAPPAIELQVHTDNTYVVNPPLGSILHGIVIPPAGGDTLWFNLVEAYRTLSQPLKDMIDGLQAVHKGVDYSEFANAKAGVQTPVAVHPVVRVHPETGEKLLFVNPQYTSYICGMSALESKRLLGLLCEHLSRVEFSVRFRWQADSVAFWDNRSTAHLGPVDIGDADMARKMQRITVAGDVPVGADGFRSQAIVGEPFGG